MLLSDGEIQLALESGELIIDPSLPSSSLQPASIDLKLDTVIRVQKSDTAGITLDPMELDVNSYINDHTDEVDIASLNGYTLKPGAFIIGKTVENRRTQQPSFRQSRRQKPSGSVGCRSTYHGAEN